MFELHEGFARQCQQAFDELVSRYSLSRAEVESIGRECYVRYHKGPRTVSIAWELGAFPIVELFFPAGPNDQPVPWAARGSVAYARRIPRLWPKSTTPSKHPPSSEHYLAQSMRQLSETESSFLEEPPQ